jgi:hypothetical protein
MVPTKHSQLLLDLAAAHDAWGTTTSAPNAEVQSKWPSWASDDSNGVLGALSSVEDHHAAAMEGHRLLRQFYAEHGERFSLLWNNMTAECRLAVLHHLNAHMPPTRKKGER